MSTLLNKLKQNPTITSIVILALIIRLSLLAFAQVEIYSGLTEFHLNIANAFLKGAYFKVESGGNFFPPTINDTPYYGTLIGLTWKIFSTKSLFPIQLLQVLLDSFMTLLIFFTAKNFFNKKTGLIAAFIFALYLPEAQLATIPLRDIFGSFGTIIFFYFFSKAYVSKSQKSQAINLFIGVALTSICTLIRPSIALVPFFFIPFLLIKWPWKQAIINGTVIALTNILFFWTPMSLVNLYNYDQPFVSPLGHGLLTGLGEFENPFGLRKDDRITIEVVRNEGYDYTYGSIPFNETLKNKAVDLIKQRPDVFATHLLKRIPKYLFMNSFFQQDYNECRLEKSRSECMQQYPSTYLFKPWSMIFSSAPILHILLSLLAFFLIPKKRKQIFFCFLIPLNLFLATWHGGHEARYILIGSHSLLLSDAALLHYFFNKFSKK